MSSRCVQGDATAGAPYEALLGGRKARLLLTDPPYCLLTRRRKGGDEREPKGRKLERGPLRRFEDTREYRAFTQAWLSKAVEHLDAEAPLVIWTNLLGRAPITTVARELGFGALRGEYVWAKRTREGNSGEELLRMVETALVFTRAPAPPQADGDPALPWAVVAGVDDDGEAARWGSHPSHKPFGVLEPLLRTWSRPGALVLDCFGGSGSIAAAALRLGRDAACLELEPEWVERITARLAPPLSPGSGRGSG